MRSGWCGPDRMRERSVVHVTTVPKSLMFFTGQGQFLRSNGWQLVAVSSPGADLAVFSSAEGVPTVEVPMSRSISPWADVRSLWRLMGVWHRLRPQVVHAHTPKGGLLGMISARVMGVPVRIYHIHGLPFETAHGLKRALLRSSEWVSCRLATQVLAVSPSIAEVAERAKLARRGSVRVLSSGSINGIDSLGRFNPDRESVARSLVRAELGICDAARVVGFSGRLVHDKGVDDLCEAWEHVKALCPSAHLIVMGEFESGDPVTKESKALLTGDSTMHLVGWVNEPERYYAAIDVLALPSHREGFGLAAAEALAMRVPVVACEIAGLVDVVKDGVTGSLITPNSSEELAAALVRYLEDADLCEQHGETGRMDMLDRFEPRSIWIEQLRLYEELSTQTE